MEDTLAPVSSHAEACLWCEPRAGRSSISRMASPLRLWSHRWSQRRPPPPRPSLPYSLAGEGSGGAGDRPPFEGLWTGCGEHYCRRASRCSRGLRGARRTEAPNHAPHAARHCPHRNCTDNLVGRAATMEALRSPGARGRGSRRCRRAHTVHPGPGRRAPGLTASRWPTRMWAPLSPSAMALPSWPTWAGPEAATPGGAPSVAADAATSCSDSYG